jgi:hypothetical protein
VTYRTPSKRRRDGYRAYLPGMECTHSDPDFQDGWKQADNAYRREVTEAAQEAERRLPILTALSECHTVDELKDFILEHLL